MARLHSVQRLSAPSLHDFRRELLPAGRPTILTGMIDGWDAMREWSIDYFIEHYGDCTWTALKSDRQGFETSEEYGYINAPIEVGPHLRRLLKGDTWDYMHVHFPLLPEAVRAQAPTPQYCRDSKWMRRKLWISAPETRTPLHFDLAFNLLTVVRGRKRITLFPPSESKHLAWNGVLSARPNFSALDPDDVDPAFAAGYERASGYECEVAAGETLFMPPRWWHYVVTEEFCITVNCWWAEGWTLIPVLAGDWWKRVRGLTR